MIRRKTSFLCIVIPALATVFAGAWGVPAARGDAPDDGFTSTTTHVEFNSLGQFLKIEFGTPESQPPPRTEEAKPGKTRSVFLNWFGIAEVDKRGVERNCQTKFSRVGILRVPFFTYFSLNDEDRLGRGRINWNLFALFDGVAEKTDETNALGGHSRFARAVFLDSLVFTGFRAEFRAPQRTEWEALDLPLSTTLWHMTDKNENRWKVVNIPFLWVFRYDRRGDRARTHIIDGPGVGLFHRDRQGDRRDDWQFLDALLIDGMRGKQRGEESHFGLLESFSLFHGPFVALYNSDVERNSQIGKSKPVLSRQVLRLPFLGPLIGTWHDDKGGHFAVLPNVFIKSKNRPKAFRFF